MKKDRILEGCRSLFLTYNCVISAGTGIGALLGKKIGKYFPPAAGNGRNRAQIMTSICQVKEATPDSLGFRFPVVVLYV